MYFLLSPAKNLNESHEFTPKFYSTPPLLNHAQELMHTLRQLAPQEIATLMHVSDKIALLNAERNQNWQPPFTPDNAKLALYLFNGDVYDGIAPRSLAEEHISYIHNHVRILSGLYGILRPLDLMQPYRLEMGRHQHRADKQHAAMCRRQHRHQPSIARILQSHPPQKTQRPHHHPHFSRRKRRQIQNHQLLRQTRTRLNGALRRAKRH